MRSTLTNRPPESTDSEPLAEGSDIHYYSSMAKQQMISAADANRKFSQVLRAVRAGRSFVVTAHGRPVARIVPISDSDQITERARRALFERLEAAPVANIGRWTRDELYDA